MDPLSIDASPKSDDSDKIRTTVRVPRELKNVVIASSESFGVGRSDYVSDCVSEQVGGLKSESGAIDDFVTFGDRFTSLIPYHTDDLRMEYSSPFGKLEYKVGYEVTEDDSGKLGDVASSLGLGGSSSSVRLCVIEHTNKHIESGNLSFSGFVEPALKEAQWNIRVMMSTMKHGFKGLMELWFVTEVDVVKDVLEGSIDKAIRFESLYTEDFKNSGSYEDAVELVGEEPFENLESVLEEVLD